MNSDGSAGARARFLAAVDGIADHEDGAGRLCAACVVALPVQRAAILINVSGVGLEVLSASDPIAERIEWMQVTLGEGPAVDSISRGVPISIPDLNQADGRWPMFLSEVAGSSLGGMYALPLQIGAVKVGALDLHCAAGAPLGAADFADAVVISELVTAVLLNSDPDGRISATLGSWWNQPLSTREVHQATGMVMAQLGVDARSAYVQLQAFAFGGGRLLTDVAGDVVNRRKRFHPDPEDDSTPGHEAPTW
ncbi:MAG: ANTAR domain-containing protein [Actinomycetia bacterium]|jgi:hypothetical protein|nr:ANTAR domain-containing protein [Actinomycetes bacterium]